MIALKKVDLSAQLILMGGLVVCAIAKKDLSLLAYLLGGWQLLSFLVHALTRNWIVVAFCRNFYGCYVLLLAIAYLLSIAFPHFQAVASVLSVLINLSPLLAVYYLLISFRELSIWQHRQFIQLR